METKTTRSAKTRTYLTAPVLPHEREEAKRRAHRAGMTLAGYIRWCVLGLAAAMVLLAGCDGEPLTPDSRGAVKADADTYCWIPTEGTTSIVVGRWCFLAEPGQPLTLLVTDVVTDIVMGPHTMVCWGNDQDNPDGCEGSSLPVPVRPVSPIVNAHIFSSSHYPSAPVSP